MGAQSGCMRLTCDLHMADISVELLQLEACVNACEVDGLIHLDVRAHHRDPAFDTLGDQLPTTFEEVFKVVWERALCLRGDAQGLCEVPVCIVMIGAR